MKKFASVEGWKWHRVKITLNCVYTVQKNNTCILTIFQVIARSFAQASSIRSLHNDKVYELRTYSIKPKNFKEFYDLSVEYMHLRTNHSKLVGYWTSEIGGIFDMVHIWEYGNYFLAFKKFSLLMFCTKCIYKHVILMDDPNNYCKKLLWR